MVAPLNVYAADPVTARLILPPIGSLDPLTLPANYSEASGARMVVENLFTGLTRYNPITQQVESALATSWQTEDRVTWTFTLRSDVQWVRVNAQSGAVEPVRPVTANDVVFALQRACDPRSPKPAAATIYIIKGCLNVSTTDPKLVDDLFIAKTLGVQATSDTTLTISLAFGTGSLPMMVSLPEFYPVPPEAVKQKSDWTAPDTVMTNGPFAVKDWSVSAGNMALVRNPSWPFTRSGNVEQIGVEFGTAEQAQQALAAGTIDFAPLNAAILDSFADSTPDYVKTAAGYSITVLGFSSERLYVKNDAFRRALAQSIDRTLLATQIARKSLMPISRFMPSADLTTIDNSGFKPDLAKAAMVAANINKCRVSEQITFAVEDQPQTLAIAQALIAQWKEVLGCPPITFRLLKSSADEIRSLAHGTVDTAAQNTNPRPHLWLATWTPDYADPNSRLGDGLHCQFGYLRTGIPCGDAESALDQAFTETDPAKQAPLYDQAQSVWFGDLGTFPVVPLFMNVNAVGQNPTLQGATAVMSERFEEWVIQK